ncbi:MAG: S49 family peptidase [Candidatus Micrarchaeia archaeon]
MRGGKKAAEPTEALLAEGGWEKGVRLAGFVVFIAALVVIAFYAASAISPKPKIALITINTPLEEPWTGEIIKMLRWAKERREVAGVVLRVNSPGGSVGGSEELYMEIARLRLAKPVVVSIEDLGASGAYYASVGSNWIYAKPSSLVGSIGVVAILPSEKETREFFEENTVIDTGPRKTVEVEQELMTQMQAMLGNFLGTVEAERGAKLKATREELGEGRIYIGSEGVALGLVDEIGSLEDAVNKAAGLAGAREYEVVDVNEELRAGSETIVIFGANKSIPPGYYYVYIHGERR